MSNLHSAAFGAGVTALPKRCDQPGVFPAIRYTPNQEPYTSSEIDHLTGLPNRRAFLQRMKSAQETNLADASCACLLLIRSEKFEYLNRTYGYNVADAYFFVAAQRLERMLEDVLLISRFSPSEFAVIPSASFANEDEAYEFCSVLAIRIRDQLRDVYSIDCSSEHDQGNSEIEFESLLFNGDFQVGISFFGSHKEPLHHVFLRALKAIERSDEGGEVRAVHYHDFDVAGHRRSMALAKDMNNEEFTRNLVQYYQLQVNSRGKLIGAECLVRWKHPSLGLLMPVDFIGLVEQSNAMLALGGRMLELACQTLQRWAKSPVASGLRLSVNVSPMQFHDKAFLTSVKEILGKYSFDHSLLRFEITECVVVKDIAAVVKVMESLRELGISLSVDDFGTGFSSLSYIQRLPVSEIKIDRSFIHDIESQSRSRHIVSAIMLLAKGLNLEVVTEGVERASQVTALAGIGESNYQGYLINRPLPLEETEALIQDFQASGVHAAFHQLSVAPIPADNCRSGNN